MDTEPTASSTPRPRKVALVVPQRRKRKTPLARRRRLNQLIRELALDCGFDPSDVTLAERGVLHQAAAFLLQVEVSSDALVRGVAVNDDTMIRLASEARRLLAGLRKRVGRDASQSAPLPWSPLRARLAAAAKLGSAEVSPPSTPKPEPVG
jgi:hypothetical protein